MKLPRIPGHFITVTPWPEMGRVFVDCECGYEVRVGHPVSAEITALTHYKTHATGNALTLACKRLREIRGQE